MRHPAIGLLRRHCCDCHPDRSGVICPENSINKRRGCLIQAALFAAWVGELRTPLDFFHALRMAQSAMHDCSCLFSNRQVSEISSFRVPGDWPTEAPFGADWPSNSLTTSIEAAKSSIQVPHLLPTALYLRHFWQAKGCRLHSDSRTLGRKGRRVALRARSVSARATFSLHRVQTCRQSVFGQLRLRSLKDGLKFWITSEKIKRRVLIDPQDVC
jgi:hypothetical protein